MAESNGRIGPWSSIDVAIEGEPLAKDGLRKRREQLEKIVFPCITTRKTNDEVLFKGKRRYLTKPLFSGDKKRFHAILALQHLYNIEAAWKAGDIDKVVRAAVGFATADHERQLMEWAAIDSVEAASAKVRHRTGSKRGADKANRRKAETRPDYKSKVKAAMASGIKYIPACEQVAADFDVTWQTVRNNTPELRPSR